MISLFLHLYMTGTIDNNEEQTVGHTNVTLRYKTSPGWIIYNMRVIHLFIACVTFFMTLRYRPSFWTIINEQ